MRYGFFFLKGNAEALSSRNLSLRNVGKFAFCHASDYSPQVRNEFRIRGRSFDGKGNDALAAACLCNFSQPSHHAPCRSAIILKARVPSGLTVPAPVITPMAGTLTLM